MEKKLKILFCLNLLILIGIVNAVPISDCGSVGAGTWELDSDLISSGTCFTIAADNVVLDLNGHTITGNGSDFGVYVGGIWDNAIIKNGRISNFSYGIYITSSDNTITNVSISDSYSDGIYIYGARTIISNVSINCITGNGVFIFYNYNTIIDSRVENCEKGIFVYRGDHNTLINIQAINNNDSGIELYAVENTTLKDSNMSGNRENFEIFGIGYGVYWDTRRLNHIIENNIVDYSYKLYYNKSISNFVYDPVTAGDAGMIVCLGCDNIVVRDLNLSHYNSHGILFVNTSNIEMENVILDDNIFHGALIGYGNNTVLNNISVNRIIESFGIWLTDSPNNTLTNIVANDYVYSPIYYSHAIVLEDSPNSYLENITANYNPEVGVYFSGSPNSILKNIEANYNNWSGLHFTWDNSPNITLINVVTNYNDYYGMQFYDIDGTLNMFNVTANYNGNTGIEINDWIEDSILRDIEANYNGWDVGLSMWYGGFNVTVENVIANNNGWGGVFIDGFENSTFTNITANNNFDPDNAAGGVYVWYSENNVFTDINANNNTDTDDSEVSYGIFVKRRSDNNIFANITSNYNEGGLYIDDRSNNNTITNNKFCFNSIEDVFCNASATQLEFTNNKCDTGNACSGSCLSCIAPGDLYWANMINTPINTADLKDSVKTFFNVAGLEGKTIEFEIKKSSRFWFDSKIAEGSGKDFIVWEAGKNLDDGSFSSGNYYFIVTIVEDGVTYDSRDYPPYGILIVSSTEINSPPSVIIDYPSINLLVEQRRFKIGNNINFNITLRDEDDDLSAEWDFGDGNVTIINNCLTGTNCNTSHSYGMWGTKTVYLTAKEMRRSQEANNYTIVFIYDEGINVFAIINEPKPDWVFGTGIRRINFSASESYVANCTTDVCPTTLPYGIADCYSIDNLKCFDLNNELGIPNDYNLWFDWGFSEGTGRYGNWTSNYEEVVEFTKPFLAPTKHWANLKVGYGAY